MVKTKKFIIRSKSKPISLTDSTKSKIHPKFTKRLRKTILHEPVGVESEAPFKGIVKAYK